MNSTKFASVRGATNIPFQLLKAVSDFLIPEIQLTHFFCVVVAAIRT
jgi:hypothetical protein